MVWSTIILGFFELLKGIAWPLVVLALATAYRPEILSFLPALFRILSRTRKLEVKGIGALEIDAADQQQIPTEDTAEISDPSTVKLREIPGLNRSEAIGNLERELHVLVRKLTVEPKDVLIRNLAQARLEAAFGLFYAGIFGSQIAGLVALEARGKVPISEAHSFYLEFEKLYPEIYSKYGFSGWLGFLRDRKLITRDEKDVSITPLGLDFLDWLRAKALSFNKPF
jgi:hypothetical protein